MFSSNVLLGRTLPDPLTIGISGDQFTINGTPTFLLGVSYFDTRHWYQSDIDQLAAYGYNAVRIWLENSSGAYWVSWHLEHDATINDPNGLLTMVRYCASKGIVCQVVILDWESNPLAQSPGTSITNVVNLLKGESNCFFDIVNEHQHTGTYSSKSTMRSYMDTAKTLHPNGLFGVSSCGDHDGFFQAFSSTLINANVDDTILTGSGQIGVDFAGPHLPRTTDWFSETDVRVDAIQARMATIGRTVPIFLQEEARRGSAGLNPTKAEFIQALQEAHTAGAAGWLFHSAASFDMSTQTYFQRLDSVELDTIDELPGSI